jgi:uncharacterized C2H2 Zn-finger protein
MDSPHQCPRCPLKFRQKNELSWHLTDEHPYVHLDYLSRSEQDRARSDQATRSSAD